jgi:hypothetical protein
MVRVVGGRDLDLEPFKVGRDVFGQVSGFGLDYRFAFRDSRILAGQYSAPLSKNLDILDYEQRRGK